MINDLLLSQLVIIDIQDKLVDVMPKSEIKKVIDATFILSNILKD
jgi:hypothetical protein